MANRMLGSHTSNVEDAVWLRTGKFTSAGTSAPTGAEGIVKSVTRTGVGALTVTLRDHYPQILFPYEPTVVGEDGVRACVESVDVSAGTMDIQLRDADGTAADSDGEDVYVAVVVRNSTVTTR